MKYYTYKVTFKDLPGYFYYGYHKDDGKLYFGTPKTWRHLWDQFEPEVKILQWYETKEEAKLAEDTIILCTWGSKYSLNESVGPKISEEASKRGGKRCFELGVGIYDPEVRGRASSNGGKSSGAKNILLVSELEQTKEARKKNMQLMQEHPETARARRENGEKSGMKVECVETGEIWRSAREAARSIGTQSSGIVRCCNKERKTCKGLTWRYV